MPIAGRPSLTDKIKIGIAQITDKTKTGMFTSGHALKGSIETMGDKIVHAKDGLMSAMQNLTCGANTQYDEEVNLSYAQKEGLVPARTIPSSNANHEYIYVEDKQNERALF